MTIPHTDFTSTKAELQAFIGDVTKLYADMDALGNKGALLFDLTRDTPVQDVGVKCGHDVLASLFNARHKVGNVLRLLSNADVPTFSASHVYQMHTIFIRAESGFWNARKAVEAFASAVEEANVDSSFLQELTSWIDSMYNDCDTGYQFALYFRKGSFKPLFEQLQEYIKAQRQ